MDDLRPLIGRMALNEPATRKAITRTETALGKSLPQDYKDFLLKHNGGEGPIGREGYGALFRVEDLPEVQERYSELDHLSGWVIFGSDMGGEAWLFAEDGSVLEVPFIGDRDAALQQGRFLDFLRRQGAGLGFASLEPEALLTLPRDDDFESFALISFQRAALMEARLRLHGIQAETSVGVASLEPEGVLYERPQAAVAALCRQMAEEWKGWTEVKRLRGGGLVLTCRHDGRGHVTVEVELRARSWGCSGQLQLEAGVLEDLARRAQAFAKIARP